MILKIKFRDRDETIEQIWGSKLVILSLVTGIIQPNKFEDLNDRFTSLGTGMTQSNKFKDRWRTLLLLKHHTTIQVKKGKYV